MNLAGRDLSGDSTSALQIYLYILVYPYLYLYVPLYI